MRTFLRRFAVVLVLGASALVAAALFGSVVLLLAGAGELAAWPFAAGVASTAVVWLGGTLWCLATATRPWPAPRPGRGPMWRWLRLVAVLQLGFGTLLAVGATTYAVE